MNRIAARTVAVSFALAVTSHAVAEDVPQVNVTNVRRVFHNGEHNGFTDLVRFKDKFYLTFRSCPDGNSFGAGILRQ